MHLMLLLVYSLYLSFSLKWNDSQCSHVKHAVLKYRYEDCAGRNVLEKKIKRRRPKGRYFFCDKGEHGGGRSKGR